MRQQAAVAAKVFIQRDYSNGTMCQFQTKFPSELETKVGDVFYTRTPTGPFMRNSRVFLVKWHNPNRRPNASMTAAGFPGVLLFSVTMEDLSFVEVWGGVVLSQCSPLSAVHSGLMGRNYVHQQPTAQRWSHCSPPKPPASWQSRPPAIISHSSSTVVGRSW